MIADDTGIADAFYTVLSVGMVLLAGLAISSVVLSLAAHHGQAVADQLDVSGSTGLTRGLYAFYYAADPSSDFSSADPGRILPGGLVAMRSEPSISLSSSGLPQGAPASMGMVIWAGYIYLDIPNYYAFLTESADGSWLWVDGVLAVDNSGIHPQKSVRGASIHLEAGLHSIKVRYFYTDAQNAWCKAFLTIGRIRSELIYYR